MPGTALGERRGESAPDRPARKGRATGIVLALSLAGLAVSGYLWSAKAGASQLICGPLGDCAAVNASPYAEILGVPVAAFGAGLYAFIAVCAGLALRRPEREGPAYAGFAAALAGAIFSLYLTALEAFVIHAYCAWCIVSWALVTGIAAVWGGALRQRRGGQRGRSHDPVHE